MPNRVVGTRDASQRGAKATVRHAKPTTSRFIGVIARLSKAERQLRTGSVICSTWSKLCGNCFRRTTFESPSSR